MSTNVTALMAGYAAKRGISAGEVEALRTKVGAVDATELAQLQAARQQHRGAFTQDGFTTFERYVNQHTLGVQIFHKGWKVDTDGAFRARWGITSKHDPKAPTFLKEMRVAEVPAKLKADFVRYAESDRRGAVREGYGELAKERVSVTSAEKVLDRDGNHIGYDLTWRAAQSNFFIEKFYRLDGKFVGGDRTFRGD